MRRRVSAFGLMIIILLLGIVAMVAGSVSLRTRNLLQMSVDSRREAIGQDVSYSGIEATLAAVERGQNNWSSLSVTSPMPHHPELTHQIKINSNYTNDQPIVDVDGTQIPPESIYVKSLARQDGALLAGATAVVAQEKGFTFNYPAFGSDSVNVDNTLIQAQNGDGSIAEGDGSIRTNGVQDSAVKLFGQSFVDGDVTVGPGGDPAVAIDAETGSGFSGESKLAGAELPLPDVPAAYDPSAPDNIFTAIPLPIPLPPPNGIFFLSVVGVSFVTPGTYNRLSIHPTSNMVLEPNITELDSTILNILIMEPGDYYVNELITEGGPITSAQFQPMGEVRIHVKNRVDFSAPITRVESANSQGFQIYQTEENGEVDITKTQGNLVLAAQSPVNVSESQILGAVYGSVVNLKDSELTYPKALDNLALNDKAKGSWNIFGRRLMTPDELMTHL